MRPLTFTGSVKTSVPLRVSTRCRNAGADHAGRAFFPIGKGPGFNCAIRDRSICPTVERSRPTRNAHDESSALALVSGRGRTTQGAPERWQRDRHGSTRADADAQGRAGASSQTRRISEESHSAEGTIVRCRPRKSRSGRWSPWPCWPSSRLCGAARACRKWNASRRLRFMRRAGLNPASGSRT